MPLLVLVVKAIVGFVLVLQQTPFAVIVAPPELEMFPPELAVKLVTEEIVVVEIFGITLRETKVI